MQINKLIEYSVVTFLLGNPTNKNVTRYLFAPLLNTDIPSTPFNKIMEPRFYISGTANYNQFVRDSLAGPKKIQRIRVRSTNQTALTNPINFIKLDANGIGCSYPQFPDNSMSVTQLNNTIAQMDVDDFTLDVNGLIQYTIPANTTISWNIYYQELELINMLSNKAQYNYQSTIICPKSLTYTDAWLEQTKITNNWVDYFETNKQSSVHSIQSTKTPNTKH